MTRRIAGRGTRWRRKRSATGWGLLLAGLILATGGCGWWGQRAYQAGASVSSARYDGLAHRRVAVLVYCDSATSFQYPQARREVSSFVTARLARAVPTARLVAYDAIIAYQDDTPNWQMLPVKAIGKHFSVDRVLYIELTSYRFHARGAKNLLRGDIAANVYVYDTHVGGSGRVFSTKLETHWPKHGPEAGFDADLDMVRMNTLVRFSRELGRCF